MKKILRNNIFYLCALAFLFSCTTDDLEPTLAQDKDVETSITSIEDLEGLLGGLYNRMTDAQYYGRDYTVYGDVRSDNAFSNGNSGRFIRIGRFDLISTDGYARDTWEQIYRVIASANIIINADAASIDGDAAEISHIQGQAYAARALAHFDLMKLYGEEHTGGTLAVPYVSEYKPAELSQARNTLAELKTSIAADFASAESMISASADDTQFISLQAVYGLESRFFLYTKNWSAAATAAAKVIGNFSILTGADYINSWGIDAPGNSIFELAYTGTDKLGNTSLGEMYNGEAYGDIEALKDLYDTFEAGDVRIDADMFAEVSGQFRNIGKYPSTQGDLNVTLLRYEEVILNYAEALWRMDSSDPAALTHLNSIPSNRGATVYASVTEDNILLERRKELAFEGFRFYDLMRTGRAVPYVSTNQTFPSTGVAYGDSNLAFPIPQDEMNANALMVQNTGY